MSVCYTICNSCGCFMNHQVLDTCQKCGSRNVEQDTEITRSECEHEPSDDNEDGVEIESADE